MSRKFVLLAAAAAFCGLSSVAEAQTGGGASMGGTNMTAPSAGAGSSMRARPMRAQRPMARQSGRMAMRGRAASGGENAAFMGGGGVFERGADGSLRPVN